MTIGIFTKNQGYTSLADWSHHKETLFTLMWGDSESEKLSFSIPVDEAPVFSLEHHPISFVNEAYEIYIEGHWYSPIKEKFKEFQEWVNGGDVYVDDIEAGVSVYVPPNEELFNHEVYGYYLPRISKSLHSQLEMLQKARSYFAHTHDYGELNEKI